MQVVRSLDLRGLRCPLPVLKTRKAVLALAAGERIAVLSDDPLAAVDIPNAMRETGDEIVLAERREKEMRFVIRRAGDR